MDSVKIFNEYLARVTESANKPNDLHKQQLIRSSNELIDMYVQAKQETEDQTKWADTYFKELQEAKKEIERLNKKVEAIYEIYADI
jgi:archaellum component FlaC